MKITNFRLFQDDDTPIPFFPSPNIGGALAPDMLIMHFTAGQNEAGAIAWMTNPASKVAAHLLVGKEGAITQLVPFNRIAYHAGTSSWKGRTALNRYAIGIELDNPGPLKNVNNQWVSSFKVAYPVEDILIAKHKFGATVFGWPKFPDAQIEAATALATLLVYTYNMTDIVGHDDVAPTRKWDPGPAFPMDEFRTEVFRRVDELKNPAQNPTP
jgi:N-acetylmuramoyl-L-alanine amidase